MLDASLACVDRPHEIVKLLGLAPKGIEMQFYNCDRGTHACVMGWGGAHASRNRERGTGQLKFLSLMRR
jgi:hypothetical protein